MADVLRLAFQRRLGTKWDDLILFATVPMEEWKSPAAVVHVETLIGDRAFSAQLGEGVRWRDDLDFSDTSLWSVVTTPWGVRQEIIDWCDSIVGSPYDIVGAVDSGIGLAAQLAGHYFCSGIAQNILSHFCGATGIPNLPCPYVLKRWADRDLATRTYTSMGTIDAFHAETQRQYATIAAKPDYWATREKMLREVQLGRLHGEEAA